ncbi:MAG: hypothetical protein D6716_07975 [Chloroflexi bacterium]|nr:MAG: hypothetical protein D6716_07975 [Chloroflexota bacterium]
MSRRMECGSHAAAPATLTNQCGLQRFPCTLRGLACPSAVPPLPQRGKGAGVRAGRTSTHRNAWIAW